MKLGAREVAMNGSERRTGFGREQDEAVQISRGARTRIGWATNRLGVRVAGSRVQQQVERHSSAGARGCDIKQG